MEKTINDHLQPHRQLQKIKDRLQCLFAYYISHVALFDLDVRLKTSIHVMLETEARDNPQYPSSCLVRKSRDCTGAMQLDAFVNVRLSDGKGDWLVADLNEKPSLLFLDDAERIYRDDFVGWINKYVSCCPSFTPRGEVYRYLVQNDEKREDNRL